MADKRGVSALTTRHDDPRRATMALPLGQALVTAISFLETGDERRLAACSHGNPGCRHARTPRRRNSRAFTDGAAQDVENRGAAC